MSAAPGMSINAVRRTALVVAVVGGALCIGGLVADRQVFFESYLVGAVFWLGASMGCAAMVMTYHLTGGRWGDAVAGVFESGVAVLPLMALLFIPVLLGVGSLYVWAHPEVVRVDPLLARKSGYLNVPWFVGRTVAYFLVWLIGGHLLVRWADLRRRTGDEAYARSLSRLSAGGLVVYVVTMTLAGFDWMMSLEPHWYSTIYGIIVIAGQGLVGIAITTITYVLLSSGRAGAAKGVLYDLGNLLLMSVAFWSYVQFSQFLIIYYGNLPEETAWYIPRTQSCWGHVGTALIVLHFAVPLALLLSRWLKQQARALLAIALGLVIMQVVAEMWMTIPAFTRAPGKWWPAGLDVAAVVGIGGLWLAMFTTQLKRRPMWALIPPEQERGVSGHGH